VNEINARMPYQAWESVAYSTITHTHEEKQYARRISKRVQESRGGQDNEQWHLLIIQEWMNRKGLLESKVKHRFMSRLSAFGFYHLTSILYAIRPSWSYRVRLRPRKEGHYSAIAESP
jgi:hypothetical protein